MKGTNPTKSDREFWDRLAQLGCVACRKDGEFNQHVSIHHIEGRTRPGAHRKVLALCAGHHQDGTGAPGLIAVHPWKTKFQQRYGNQLDLLAECVQLLESHD